MKKSMTRIRTSHNVRLPPRHRRYGLWPQRAGLCGPRLAKLRAVAEGARLASKSIKPDLYLETDVRST